MLVRSLASILITVASFTLVSGQTPDLKKENTEKRTAGELQRDMPFPGGVNLAYVVYELAGAMNLNVLFDSESRLENRKVRIELKNVTTAEALDYLLLQEGLGFKKVGRNTILVAIQSRLTSIHQTGASIALMEAAKTAGGTRPERLRDVPFPGGVDLQYIIKELAKDMDLNVLFDAESRLENRKARIELKSVTSAEALNYLLLQEGLIFEEAGPKTILVASRIRATTIPQIGVGTTLLTKQLAQYFGVEGGVLINQVLDDSPGSKAGLKAGDVIVEIDGEPVRGAIGLMQTLNDKKEGEITLKIVRERRDQTVNLSLRNTAP